MISARNCALLTIKEERFRGSTSVVTDPKLDSARKIGHGDVVILLESKQ